jgi:hypothetical protein
LSGWYDHQALQKHAALSAVVESWWLSESRGLDSRPFPSSFCSGWWESRHLSNRYRTNGNFTLNGWQLPSKLSLQDPFQSEIGLAGILTQSFFCVSGHRLWKPILNPVRFR